jgi:hypothetical protein
MRTVSAQLKVPAKDLVSRLSYSHLEQLVVIEDPLKRAFYEIECLRGNWSVREAGRIPNGYPAPSPFAKRGMSLEPPLS